MNITVTKVKGEEWKETIDFIRGGGMKKVNDFNRKLLVHGNNIRDGKNKTK
jgi:hypothetical protein